MKIKYSLLLVIFLTSGCLFNGKTDSDVTLTGTWRLYDLEQIKSLSKDDEAFSKTASLKKTVTDGAVLCFFPDGIFSEIKGAAGSFSSGNWKLSKDNNSIQFQDSGRTGLPVPFKIEKNPNGRMLLTLSNEPKNLAIKFIKESEALEESIEDPFYTGNNQWRIKPAQPENSAELTSRLSNYLKHLALILKSAKERKQTVVSFEFSLGPVKIYNGGIGIYPYGIVPENWKNSFYDEADASATYHKYEDYLKTSSYRGAGIGNWIEDDYNILLSIYAGINQSKSTKTP
jgi:hypothetical protein